MISDNLLSVQNEIKSACAAGTFKKDVRLVAVSKTRTAEEILEAYNADIRDFGENKVQELCGKYNLLPPDIRWHLIGHLQRNKVKDVIGKTFLIHSVDSLRLAEEIEKQAARRGITVDILIEVNVSGEESKFGAAPSDLEDLLRAISHLSHVSVRGLMTVAPEESDAEKVRPVFRKLYNLSIDIKALNIDNIHMDFLSMGMSGDFTVAIGEGSDIVRIGTKIFGKRNYNI